MAGSKAVDEMGLTWEKIYKGMKGEEGLTWFIHRIT